VSTIPSIETERQSSAPAFSQPPALGFSDAETPAFETRPFVAHRTPVPQARGLAVKHAVDRICAAILLTLLAPLFVLVAVLVLATSRGPVFFRQRRTGRHGRDFTMLKFRTMWGTPEELGEANAPWAARMLGEAAASACDQLDRRTRLGRALRRYSIDELPQLVNVLLGQMSLVGPRPELPHYAQRFESKLPGYSLRHTMRPGMTGWVQIHDRRCEASFAERLAWDLEYVYSWSLRFDVRILLRTRVVVRGGA
jgi:lipopolysaccharide/colanic/teichoic acid biosynthesis glycosyltransferase